MLQRTLSCGERRQIEKIFILSFLLQLPLSCGERPDSMYTRPLIQVLQLTLSCGERAISIASYPCWSRYNSRSPAESDYLLAIKYYPRQQLQLTLSCGERPGEVHIQVNCEGATTHALLRRATALPLPPSQGRSATTHALLRRATVILTEFVIDVTSNCGN